MRKNKHLKADKIIQQLLETEDAQGDKPPVVFVLSGALSPVHNMHIQCFEVSMLTLPSLTHSMPKKRWRAEATELLVLIYALPLTITFVVRYYCGISQFSIPVARY